MRKIYITIVLILLHSLSDAQTRKRLPEPINMREYIEYAPTISADGKTLIFQSERYGIFISGDRKVPVLTAEGNTMKQKEDESSNYFGIYESKLHPSGEWNQANHIEAINSFFLDEYHTVIGGPSISYDGNYIYFFSSSSEGKIGHGREDLFYSVREKNGWSKPINLGAEINTAGYEAFPSISPDNKTLYFVKEVTNKTLDGTPVYRIMMSEKGRDGKWKAPIELPAPINIYSEKAPRIMADGHTLVFSSKRAGGKGDFDLYKSVLQEDGSWSQPVNLTFVNTKKADQHVAISACGDLMFFTIDGDIFTVPVPEELRPFKIATIQGLVTDKETNLPVKSRIIVKNLKDKKLLTTIENSEADGRYTLLLPVSDDYEVSVNDISHELFSYQINKEQLNTCDVIAKDMNLIPIKTKTVAQVSEKPKSTPEIAIQSPESPTDTVVDNDSTKTLNSEKKTISASINLPPKDTVLAISTPQNTVIEKDTLKKVVAKVKSPIQKAAIEEVEVNSEPEQEQKTEKIVAEGDKPKESQEQSDLVVMFRVINAESSEVINSANIQLKNKEGASLQNEIQRSGEFNIIKFKMGDSFKMNVSANGFLPANVNFENLNSDKKISVKLKPKQANLLKIKILDNEQNIPLTAKLIIVSAKNKDSLSIDATDGAYSLTLKNDDQLTVKTAVKGYLPLQKSISIKLPEEGKIYTLEMRLVKEEYKLHLEALDVETKAVLAQARFEIINLISGKSIETLGDFTATDKSQYKIICRAVGYLPAEQELDDLKALNTVSFKLVKQQKEDKIIKSADFGNIERGKAITLKNIYFDLSKSNLKPESFVELDKLVDLMKENASINILIKGHTDLLGDPDDNLILSVERCEAVIKYLVKKGIDKKRLSKEGKGSTEPIIKKEDERNRRVEFIIL